ncbi:hypothetical protein PPERSA_08729 [Pseudocohnilembus persalinus]|uniref:Uncharacterized protein n=1 Tax=Pseudocohnilembus persalinus TaxID=266149 RepID=A0A0V0QXH1_PSEPJ|nr:hypothetical protein PPERSA_08729 [Pseudocohnilembus persalinus]|eukprot:KRX07052.1 hypothetical protein PPERSA_08729 [Pseudocohnilembus persalinus]
MRKKTRKLRKETQQVSSYYFTFKQQLTKREKKLQKQKEAEKSSRQIGDSTFRSQQGAAGISARSYGKGTSFNNYATNPSGIKELNELNGGSSQQTNVSIGVLGGGGWGAQGNWEKYYQEFVEK